MKSTEQVSSARIIRGGKQYTSRTVLQFLKFFGEVRRGEARRGEARRGEARRGEAKQSKVNSFEQNSNKKFSPKNYFYGLPMLFSRRKKKHP